MKEWGNRLPARWVRRLPGAALLLKAIAEAPTGLLHDPNLLAEIVTLEFVVFALDALTLWLASRGLGDTPSAMDRLCQLHHGIDGGDPGPIPLGLGTFEAACVGMLSLPGVAIETALAATLLLRGFTFWLPILPGLWLARRAIASE